MLLQTTPTQQSVQRKPRGGKSDSENSWKRLTRAGSGMCLSTAVNILTINQGKTVGPNVQKGSQTFKEFGEAGEATTIPWTNKRTEPAYVLSPEKSAMHTGIKIFHDCDARL